MKKLALWENGQVLVIKTGLRLVGDRNIGIPPVYSQRHTSLLYYNRGKLTDQIRNIKNY